MRTSFQLTGLRASTMLGGVLFCFALSPAAISKDASTPTCRALVSRANDLYLADTNGQIVTQFTHGGSTGPTKEYATISPNGLHVAYAILSGTQGARILIVNSGGEQRSLSAYEQQQTRHTNYASAGPVMGLKWSSDDVLQLQKHASPYASYFEFRHIHDDFQKSFGRDHSNGIGSDCAMESNGARIACLRVTESGAGVTINGKHVFYDSILSSSSPTATYVIANGSSLSTGGSPNFLLSIVGFHRGSIGLKVLLPNGNGGTEYLPPGNFLTIWWNDQLYGFSTSLVDAQTGIVKVIEVAGAQSGDAPFDPAIAWEPRGRGILVIRRTDAQQILYLLEPTRRAVSRGDTDIDDARNSWSVIARTPFPVIESVSAVHFVTPSTLLVKTSTSAFYTIPITIQNRQRDRDNAALTLGTSTALPMNIPLSINGVITQNRVLGWSCQYEGSHQWN